jgi:hypothetical protein
MTNFLIIKFQKNTTAVAIIFAAISEIPESPNMARQSTRNHIINQLSSSPMTLVA